MGILVSGVSRCEATGNGRSGLAAYVEKSLAAGEEIRYSAGISLWRYWARFLIGGLLIVGVLPTFMMAHNAETPMRWLLLVVLVLGLLVFFWPFVVRRSTELVITNKRLIVKHGLVSTHSIEIRFEKIETVRVNQGLFGKIFKYGDILVTGTGSTFDPIPAISHPLEFRTALNQEMELNRPGSRPAANLGSS